MTPKTKPTTAKKTAQLLAQQAANEARHDKEVAERYETYASYNRMMRSWLVAYAIGAPLILATNDSLSVPLAESGHGTAVAVMFLLCLSFQVMGAFINKWAAWNMYNGEYEESHQKSRWYKFWNYVNDLHWLDFAIDFSSLVLLGVATVVVVMIVNPSY